MLFPLSVPPGAANTAGALTCCPTLAKAPQPGAKDDGEQCSDCREQQRDFRRRQNQAVDPVENVLKNRPHLTGCLGIVAGNDQAGFDLHNCRRSDFRLVIRTRGQAKKRDGN
jgi:hypothetical protein